MPIELFDSKIQYMANGRSSNSQESKLAKVEQIPAPFEKYSGSLGSLRFKIDYFARVVKLLVQFPIHSWRNQDK